MDTLEEMQLVNAGPHQLLLLELEPEVLAQGAREAGFECEVTDTPRALALDLEAPERESPLLLFDAADTGNTGWFSRSQFYVDARTGIVLQTPFTIANRFEGNGRPLSRSLRLQIAKELPVNFKLPGRQPVNERTLYAVLFNLLQALQTVGVGVCGSGLVHPLAGRLDAPPSPPFTRG